jgi:hypothetical protein
VDLVATSRHDEHAVRALESRDFGLFSDIGTEALSLVRHALHQLIARDTELEARIVLDQGRRASLTTARPTVHNDGVQALARSVHRSRKASGTSPDDQNVSIFSHRSFLQGIGYTYPLTTST